MVQLTFHGAAETVTGSKYLVEADGGRILVDCGMFQGLKKLRLLNWDRPAFEPSSVQAIVLTHAHLDHVGYLPKLVREGFRGTIYCTPATEDLAELILFDSAKTQESDAEYANRKGFSKHKPALPLYDARDVSRTLRLFKSVPRGEWFSPEEPIWARYSNVGHLLGASLVEIEIRGGSKPLRIVFSGDVGRYDAPLYHDPAPPPPCDFLVCESTYGNVDHPKVDLLDELAEVVNASIRRGGVMLLASFAVGRAQQLIYLLRVLISGGKIPELPIFLDSPMAVNATNVYSDYAADHDLSEGDLGGAASVLDGRNVHLARSVAESKAINSVEGPAVVISSSGMMTGGRILHHLRKRLPDERNTIVLAGFMAEGTRGRRLQEGEKFLRMHGRDVPVRAAIVGMSALSGHAGHSELLRWLGPLEPAPRRVFLTHGEKDRAVALADELRVTRGWDTVVPKLGESFTLSRE